MKLRHGDKIFIIIAGMIISIYMSNNIMFQDNYPIERLIIMGGGAIIFLSIIPWSIYRVVLYFKTKKQKSPIGQDVQHT